MIKKEKSYNGKDTGKGFTMTRKEGLASIVARPSNKAIYPYSLLPF